MKVMKAHAGSRYPGTGKYLDVCYLQSVITMAKPAFYYMTLLAHAAVHKQKEMVKYLLRMGASKK